MSNLEKAKKFALETREYYKPCSDTVKYGMAALRLCAAIKELTNEELKDFNKWLEKA